MPLIQRINSKLDHGNLSKAFKPLLGGKQVSWNKQVISYQNISDFGDKYSF